MRTKGETASGEPPDPEWVRKALSEYRDWLQDEGVKTRTEEQYAQTVRTFLRWTAIGTTRPSSLPAWTQQPASLDDLADYGRGWLDPSWSQSRINANCSALSSFGRSVELPVDFRAFKITSVGEGRKPKNTPSLTNQDLRSIRRLAGRFTPSRVSIELAIAGLTSEEIAKVISNDIAFSKSERRALVTLEGRRPKIIFDLVSLNYFAKAKTRMAFPAEQTTKASGVGEGEPAPWGSSKIAENIRVTTSAIRPGPAARMLREAGARRSIARGFHPAAIAKSLGYRDVPARWWGYARHRSRQTNLMWEPIIPEWELNLTPEQKRAPIGDLTDEEFDALLNLEPSELESIGN